MKIFKKTAAMALAATLLCSCGKTVENAPIGISESEEKQ